MVLWLPRRMLGRGFRVVVFEYDFGKGCADGEKSRFN